MLIWLGIEETGRLTGNRTDAMTAEDLKAIHGIDDKITVINDQVQGAHDTVEGDLGRAGNVESALGAGPVQDIGARVTDGAQVNSQPIIHTILNVFHG
jgi:hypothetical protein